MISLRSKIRNVALCGVLVVLSFVAGYLNASISMPSSRQMIVVSASLPGAVGSDHANREHRSNSLVNLTDRLNRRAGDGRVVTIMPPYSNATFVYSILTTFSFHSTRLRHVMASWGKHVNVAFITTDRVDPDFPKTVVLGEGERDLGGKALQAFEKFCEFDADFFVLIDDDAFVVAHNLERVVASRFDRSKPLYGGYSLTHTPVAFIGGGGGIVVSNATMSSLCRRIQELQPSPCKWQASRSLPGDVAISLCMQSLHIAATHIDGFSPFPMSRMVDDTKQGWCKITWWLPKHLKCNPPHERAITMHYVPLEEFSELYFLTYQFHAEDSW